MTKPGRITVCAVGLKGATFLEGLLKQDVRIGLIVTYQQADDRAGSFERTRDLAARHSIEMLETRHPVLQAGDLIFLVGWQYLLPAVTPTTVVFHDSILPRYRGFASGRASPWRWHAWLFARGSRPSAGRQCCRVPK